MTEQTTSDPRRRDLRRTSHGDAGDVRVVPAAGLLQRLSRRRGRSAAVTVLSAVLVVGGVLQVQAHARSERAAAAVAAEHARVAAVEDAWSARLSGQAEAYAQERLDAALTAAETAAGAADDAIVLATPVLEPATLDELRAAAAELAALTGPAGTGTAGAAAAVEDGATGAGVDVPARTGQASRAGGTAARPPLAEAAAGSTAADAGDPAADLSRDPATTALEEIEAPDRIAAAAARVEQLSAELEAAAAARIAETARLVAAEAAERAAAEERARKVALAASAANGQIPADALCSPAVEPTALLRCDAATALDQLNEAYRAAFGRDLEVVSSYRSLSAQVATKRSRGSLAAAPGTSNHGLGVAVDFGGFGGLGNFSTANYRWMAANAGRFGWYHPRIMQPGGGGPQEPWHWEYGTPE